MAIIDQALTEKYALYNGDCLEVLPKIGDGKIHLSVYSPPFAGLYHYSSSDRDFSNCRDYEEFFEMYTFLVKELFRVTMPGRMTCVHCMDVPRSNNGKSDSLMDFPGDIIRLHEREGWAYVARYHVWKEPLTVRNRTMTKSLAHKTIVDDSSRCTVASADYLLVFRRKGENPVPIAHPYGLKRYAGARAMPSELLKYRNWTGKQTENRFSHWIWRQYASAFWDDVRLDRVLPYKPARDADDERAITLWSNPGEVVGTPFMGVGSEVYGAYINGRKSVGIELKPSYYHQAIKNLSEAKWDSVDEEPSLFNEIDDFGSMDEAET